jgi:hypothetical protein
MGVGGASGTGGLSGSGGHPGVGGSGTVAASGAGGSVATGGSVGGTPVGGAVGADAASSGCNCTLGKRPAGFGATGGIAFLLGLSAFALIRRRRR